MPEAIYHFPLDFKWGVSTAAYQVEGNLSSSDWWSWEKQTGRIEGGQRSKWACNWWHNAEADFDRASQMGVNALRLSVEWSRVEPNPGEYSKEALDRYAAILRALRDRDIEPMVTLHHFVNPGWVAELGGWANSDIVERFGQFAGHVVEILAPYCSLWCTFNSPNAYAYLAYLVGVFPPGVTDIKIAAAVVRNMLQAHAAAYRAIHAAQPEARVGLAHQMQGLAPANPLSRADTWATRVANHSYNENALAALAKGRWTPPLGFWTDGGVRDTLDWIGLNYFGQHFVAFDRSRRETLYHRIARPDEVEVLDGGYGQPHAPGMLQCLKRLNQLNVPIYITENGWSDEKDDRRRRYLLTHLHQMWHAIQRCYPIAGYYHRSLVDCFEWSAGWNLRFGLVSVDPETKRRRARASARLYKEVIREGAITPDVIDRYAPELRSSLLPG
jgi:beta-glucosidase